MTHLWSDVLCFSLFLSPPFFFFRFMFVEHCFNYPFPSFYETQFYSVAYKIPMCNMLVDERRRRRNNWSEKRDETLVGSSSQPKMRLINRFIWRMVKHVLCCSWNWRSKSDWKLLSTIQKPNHMHSISFINHSHPEKETRLFINSNSPASVENVSFLSISSNPRRHQHSSRYLTALRRTYRPAFGSAGRN